MHCHLVLPGLFVRFARDACAELELPALAWLFGHGQRRNEPALPLNRLLAGLFGLGENAPLAALRRMGEADASQGLEQACWLCADPVHLHYAGNTVLLTDLSRQDAPDEAETAALLDALNAEFAADGYFEAGSPRRWYLRLAEMPDARFFDPEEIFGGPAMDFLPQGKDGLRWRRLLNEIQVVLHNHPVNRAREAAGRTTINSLWLWGAGDGAAQPVAPGACMPGENALARGMAMAAKVPVLPAAFENLPSQGETLIWLDKLRLPAMQHDWVAWREALTDLERDWFAPLCDALRRGQLTNLRLTLPGEERMLTVELSAASRFCFWRRPLALRTVLDTLMEDCG